MGDARDATVRSAGIQAQDLWASRLAVRARAETVDLSDVITATRAPATLVRSWLMRGTLHMVAADDLRWLTELFRPRIEAMYGRRWLGLGFTTGLLDRVGDALPGVLAGTALTRAGLVAALGTVGVQIPTTDQAPTHLTLWASVQGLICRGAESGSEPTYVLADEWLPAGPGRTGAEAMHELARRYLRAFGPTSAEDFAAWSRLPMGPIRRTIEDLGAELETCQLEGRTQYLLDPAPTARRVVRLLPAFDSYVMGYHRRHLFLDPARHTDILHGGMIYPMILLDGVIIGTWRLSRTVEPALVTAEFFGDQEPWVRGAVEREVGDVGRFLGRDCSLRVVDRIR